MTGRTEPPDLKRHLRQLERRVEQIERASRVRRTTQRPKLRGVEEWTGSALPTTDLRLGRVVYATALSNTSFGPDNGKRLYIYAEAPIGQTPPTWRLFTPIVYSVDFSGATSAGGTHDAVSAGFGVAPVPVDAVVDVDGIRSSTANSSSVRITRTATGSVTPLSTARSFTPAQVANVQTPVGTFHESRPVGADISYGVQFFSVDAVNWDTWRITVTLT